MSFSTVLFSLISSAAVLAAGTQPQAFRRPLIFEPNQGQAPAQVKWMARGPGYRLFLTSEGVTMTIQEGEANYSVMRLKLGGSRPWNNLTGLEPTGGVSNYLRSADGKGSVTKVRHYARVTVAGVYPGVDMVFYGNGGNLEYDFVVAPGADPKQIQLAFEGTKRMSVDEKSGDLVLTTAGGSELRHVRPQAYQQVGEQRASVAGGYQLMGRQRVGFSVANYDRQRPLVIDPTVSFVTTFGFAREEQVNAVAVDSAGNAYVTGGTDDTAFPVTNGSTWSKSPPSCDPLGGFGSFCSQSADIDIFVAKLSPTGNILFATYGGLGSGRAIALDSTGVYVTGNEEKPDGDNVIGFAGGADTFVWKLSLAGDSIYSNRFGAAKDDVGTSIAVDSLHNAWIAGWSESYGPHAVVNIIIVGPTGLFVRDGQYSSGGDSRAFGIAVDPADQPWITGQTCGGGFPVTNALTVGLDSSPVCKVFVVQLERGTASLITQMSMVLGGSAAGDSGLAILPNGSNAAYITGVTSAQNFPTTVGAYQTANLSLGPSAFVAEVTDANDTGRIVRATLLGGNVPTGGTAITSIDAGAVYVGGYTKFGGFVQKLKSDLTQSFFAQTLFSHVYGLAVLNPTAASGVPEIYAAGDDTHDTNVMNGFVAKLDEPRYSSLRFADVNGDGRPDICGRGAAGLYCALNDGTGGFGSAQSWDSFFSDGNIWYLPEYGTTMMFADINGDGKADACARGIAGIWCELSTGTSFGTPSLVQGDFSDANGWNNLDYYASLRFADVNGDGRPDICGRGAAGVYCALNNGNGTFGSIRLWDSFFSDANSWQLPVYGVSMMFADINGDGKADACARGMAGIWCEVSTGTGFGNATLVQTGFSDANGWSQAEYYASLRFADVNGDGKPDICGRGAAGVYCALNNGNGTFGSIRLWDSFFSDANSWQLPVYGTTMMFADINGDGKADACARGIAGIWCESSAGAGFVSPYLVQTDFSDAQNWLQLYVIAR